VSNTLLTAFVYGIIPTAVAVVATAVATFWSPGAKVRSGLLHFAAGVVFAVVAVDLLPGILAEKRPLWVIIGFTAGVALMLAVRWLDKGGAPGNEDEQAERTKDRKAREGRWPVSLLAGAAVDQVVSGLLLGIGIAAGARVGVLLTFAMAIEDVTFGLALVTILAAAATRWQMIGTNAGLGLLFTAVTVAAAALLPAHSSALSTLILAFGSAALLFVVTEQLLVKAHKQPEAPFLAASFFLGFLLLLILDMVA
jgi:zinc transporter, ZIP family